MPRQGASAVLMPPILMPTTPQDGPELVPVEQYDGMNQRESPDHGAEQQELVVLAYLFWEERGCPEGSPEEDWYRAVRERKLRSKTP